MIVAIPTDEGVIPMLPSRLPLSSVDRFPKPLAKIPVADSVPKCRFNDPYNLERITIGIVIMGKGI